MIKPCLNPTFNRTTVECKLAIEVTTTAGTIASFNRTTVECKLEISR